MVRGRFHNRWRLHSYLIFGPLFREGPPWHPHTPETFSIAGQLNCSDCAQIEIDEPNFLMHLPRNSCAARIVRIMLLPRRDVTLACQIPPVPANPPDLSLPIYYLLTLRMRLAVAPCRACAPVSFVHLCVLLGGTYPTLQRKRGPACGLRGYPIAQPHRSRWPSTLSATYLVQSRFLLFGYQQEVKLARVVGTLQVESMIQSITVGSLVSFIVVGCFLGCLCGAWAPTLLYMILRANHALLPPHADCKLAASCFCKLGCTCCSQILPLREG